MTTLSSNKAVPMTQVPDRFGQRHPLESPELIAIKLQELDQVLQLMRPRHKQAYETALLKCPDQVEVWTFIAFVLNASM